MASTTSEGGAKNLITMKTSDNEVFEVEEAVALQCMTIRQMIDEGCKGDCIPLMNVDSKTFPRIIEYCKKHCEAASKVTSEEKAVDEEIKAWDADFVRVDQATLFDIILAANYLHIQSLLDLTCQTVADMIKGKTPEEIRRTFNIKNDFSQDEEDEIRRENQWAFE